MTNDRNRSRLVLVDGHGLAYRAYHALPPTLSTSTGEPTNVVFGFTSMLLEVLNDFAPDFVIVCFDSGKSFRHALYEAYKSHRPEAPDDLRHQLERIRQLLEALNIPIVTREGFEADDLIGTLARQATEQGLEVLIVTGDTDLLQLVCEHVTVILPGRQRFGDYRVYNREAVYERYGLPPERLPEFKALVGDPSDNIPGVPGIGEKTATRLLQTFPSLKALFAGLDTIEPARVREALHRAQDEVWASLELATIVRDVDIRLNLEQARFGYFDRDRVLALFRELEFRSLVARLPQPRQPVIAVVRPPSQRQTVFTLDELTALQHDLTTCPAFALDVETTALHPMYAELVGLAIATAPDRSYYIPLGHLAEHNQLSRELVVRILGPFLVDPRCQRYAHNGKYDALVLERAGFPRPKIDFDTMIAAYLLGENALGLKELAFTKLGWEMEAITELIGRGKKQLTINHAEITRVTNYACADVEATYRLVDVLRPQLEVQNQLWLFLELELPLIEVLIDMEQAGIAIDVAYLQDLSVELDSQIRTLERHIYELAGSPFNINSPQQLSKVLFEELRLPRGKRTKTGYSVSQEVLEGLRDTHPIVEKILEYRQLLKLKSTYVDALPRQVHPETGRVHTIFHQTVATTGRLSSSDPNLQNIPVRGELGRAVRRAFIADNRPQYRIADEPILLLSVDYSQIELRLMAHFSQDPALLRAFAEGKDVHAATAAEVFGVPISEVSPEMRRIAKIVNFGLMYGMQAYGLARDTGMTRQEAQRFIEAYFHRFPGVAHYLNETRQKAAEQGYVETLFGRRRYLPEITSSNPTRRQAAERMAVNMPLQGTAADIMKLAMIRVHQALKERNLQSRMLLQVHDELVLEVPQSELSQTAELVTSRMREVVTLSVPLEVEAKVGPNWADLELLRVKLSY